MTKAEIVDMINMLPGPMVTTRARKDTLLEILAEREMAMDKCMGDPCECDPCDCGKADMMPMDMPAEMPMDMPMTESYKKTEIIAIVVIMAFVAISIYGLVFVA